MLQGSSRRPFPGFVLCFMLVLIAALVGWEISHGGSDVELDEKRTHLEESSRDGGVLGALEKEAERAQQDAKAAKHRAQEARGFASAKSRSRIQRDEQEGVTLEREMLAVKIERERAYLAIQNESKAKKRVAEVQKEAVLRRKIAGLQEQSAQFRQQAETFKDRAKAYIKEAQLRARKQTVAQEMTNIMAEAPFNKRAEHVLGILKQLQAEKEDLQAKAAALDREKSSLKAFPVVRSTDSSQVRKAERDASEAKEEAAKARAYLQHANDSAEMDAQEVSALDKELKSVRVAREQVWQTVSDAQRAFVRGGDVEKREAGSTLARKQAAAAKRDVAAQKSNRSRMTQGEDAKGKSHIDTSQEELQGLRSLVRKLESERRSVKSDRRREKVYQRAYRDAFHEAFKAVFGSQSKASTYRMSGAVLPDGSIQPVHDTSSNGQNKVVHDSHNVRRAHALSRAQVISGDGTEVALRSGQALAKSAYATKMQKELGQKKHSRTKYEQTVRDFQDDIVPFSQAVHKDREHGALTGHLLDHFAGLDPESKINRRLLHGTLWKYTNPEVPYAYGKKLEDHPDRFTSVKAGNTEFGGRVKDWPGGGEGQWHQVNSGKLGDHIVGAADRMVPKLASDDGITLKSDEFLYQEHGYGAYTGSVQDNVKMARQTPDDGMQGDGMGSIPKGETNTRLVYGDIEKYGGDKQLAFGDQMVPLKAAIKQQWGAGNWDDMHSRHLADFFIASNPTGNPRAFGTHPFQEDEGGLKGAGYKWKKG